MLTSMCTQPTSSLQGGGRQHIHMQWNHATRASALTGNLARLRERRGRGVGGLPVRLHWGEKKDCKLILDQNLEQQGSMIIFRALQERDAVSCEQSGVSQTSTVNVEVMFVLCKSCNNYKLLENLPTKLCSYQSLVKWNFYFIWNSSHLMDINAVNCVQLSGEICVNVMIFLKLLLCAECY